MRWHDYKTGRNPLGGSLIWKILYSLIVTVLAGIIFASVSPVLDIKAAPPLEIAARLLDEFFSSRDTLTNRLFDDEDDVVVPVFGGAIAITVTVTNLSTGDPTLPNIYSLSQNYPNPFNSTTIIEYTLPEQARVRIDIYNSIGQLVTTLVEGTQPAGFYRKEWSANDRASGVYFYRITAGQFRQSRKMVLIK